MGCQRSSLFMQGFYGNKANRMGNVGTPSRADPAPSGRKWRTMLTLHLGGYRKCRLWLDELPAVQYTPLRVEERTLASSAPGKALKSAAVELLLPMGPRVMYGLLGATFTSVPSSGTLLVQVALSGADGGLHQESLAGQLDQVRAGLPEEYAESVWEGLQAPSLPGLGAGVLRVGCAAHGQVGSAPWLFKRLAQAVVLALAAGEGVAWDEAILGLLK